MGLLKDGAAVFTPIADRDSYHVALHEWVAAGRDGTIPVCVEERPDLRASVDLANTIYQGVVAPPSADLGVWLGTSDPVFESLIAPLADAWTSAEEVLRALSGGAPLRILVGGLYDRLTFGAVRDLLICGAGVGAMIAFISGRDPTSLAWFAAKQWARFPTALTRRAIFTDVEAGEETETVEVFGPERLDRSDVRAAVMAGSWRAVMFQGHGKDDSVNLGDWTVCGLNCTAHASSGRQRPRCGYGYPCYKDESKLIDLKEVPAAEIVLSSCNSAPLSDLALYDPKYILLLNAIDGPARDIIAAVSVHSSGLVENAQWTLAEAFEERSSAGILNASLRDEQPFPAYWHFGVPGPVTQAGEQSDELSEDIAIVAPRVHSLLSSGLLGTRHPIRKRLESLSLDIARHVTRAARFRALAQADALRSFADRVQSIDQAICGRIDLSGDDDLARFGDYFSDRSRIVEAWQAPCNCGRMAYATLRRGVIAAVPDLISVICLRCGDTEFRWSGAPKLSCVASEAVKGSELEVTVAVEARPGLARLGLFVPSYMRGGSKIAPPSLTVRSDRKGRAERRFTIVFDAALPPQAYYFTAYAVQELGMSTLRRHFGIHPQQGRHDRYRRRAGVA